MSGWDTSSRPAWDPEGESGDSTQAPDHSETSNDPWPEYGRDAHDQGGYRSQGAAEQDHARRDYEAGDFAPKDRGSADRGSADWVSKDWGSTDWGSTDYTSSDFSRPGSESRPV